MTYASRQQRKFSTGKTRQGMFGKFLRTESTQVIGHRAQGLITGLIAMRVVEGFQFRQTNNREQAFGMLFCAQEFA